MWGVVCFGCTPLGYGMFSAHPLPLSWGCSPEVSGVGNSFQYWVLVFSLQGENCLQKILWEILCRSDGVTCNHTTNRKLFAVHYPEPHQPDRIDKVGKDSLTLSTLKEKTDSQPCQEKRKEVCVSNNLPFVFIYKYYNYYKYYKY